MSSFAAVLQLPFGRLGVLIDGERLSGLQFLPPTTPLKPPSSPLACEVADQLDRWCRGATDSISLPYELDGTLFQQRVWQAMCAIPPGSTRTYGEVAHELGSSARAVGGACGRNPLPVLVPCHRIVGRDGLGGFNQGQQDWLLDIKRWLLRHESEMAARRPA